MNVYEKKFQKTVIVFNDYSSSDKYVCFTRFTLSAQQMPIFDTFVLKVNLSK